MTSPPRMQQHAEDAVEESLYPDFLAPDSNNNSVVDELSFLSASEVDSVLLVASQQPLQQPPPVAVKRGFYQPPRRQQQVYFGHMKVTSSKNLVPCKAVSSVRYLLGADLPSERRKPRLKAPPPPRTPPPALPLVPAAAPPTPLAVEEDSFAAFEPVVDATEILRVLDADADAVRPPVLRGMDDLIPAALVEDERQGGVETPASSTPQEPPPPPGKYCLRPRSSSRRNVVLLSDEDDEGAASPEDAHVAVAVGRRRRGGEAAGRRPRKGRPQPLSKYRRRTANARERQRMREINAAFETLRSIVPVQKGAEAAPDDCEKMTKITTLRLAMRYISALTQALAQSKAGEGNVSRY